MKPSIGRFRFDVIELNAVRAGIVGQSKDYAWCSYATTTGERASRYALSDGEVCCVGTDPAWEGAVLRRMVWIGAGKIFGGRTFVEELFDRSDFPWRICGRRH